MQQLIKKAVNTATALVFVPSAMLSTLLAQDKQKEAQRKRKGRNSMKDAVMKRESSQWIIALAWDPSPRRQQAFKVEEKKKRKEKKVPKTLIHKYKLRLMFTERADSSLCSKNAHVGPGPSFDKAPCFV